MGSRAGPSAAEGADGDPRPQAAAIYATLEQRILPAFYSAEARYASVMRGSDRANGSFFNTERMVQQYAIDAYRL